LTLKTGLEQPARTVTGVGSFKLSEKTSDEPTLIEIFLSIHNTGFSGGILVAATYSACNSHSSAAMHTRGTLMNQDQVKGKWNQLKGEIKNKWARMTDDDLLEVEGDMDKLAGRIQERTGDKREDIRNWLNQNSN